MRSILSRSRTPLALCFGLFVAAGIGLREPALHASLPLENLPFVGTSTGVSFTRDCPANHVLTGVRWRQGLALDGIGIKCRPVKSDGTFGTEINSGTMAGGGGGDAGSASCPGTVIASQTGAPQLLAPGIAYLRLGCFQWFPASRSWGGNGQSSLYPKGGGLHLPALITSTCVSGTKPATGIRGRHGSIVDAFSLKCNTP